MSPRREKERCMDTRKIKVPLLSIPLAVCHKSVVWALEENRRKDRSFGIS